MQVSIITSLFNRLELTRPYLQSLERTLAGWEYEIILVDDVSTDGTREFLAGLTDPRHRVVLNAAKGSFAANNNAGAQLARAPLLCFLNNDILLLPGWLEPMARLARRVPDVAVVGNVQREPVSGLIDHYGCSFDAGGNAFHAGRGHAAAPAAPYLDWPALTAACWVIRKEVFLRLGGFDEQYHNGFEDLDFCLRATVAGYRHFAANRSVIYHHISASPGRKRHDDANHQLFRQRWHEWLAQAARTRRTAADLRAEGGRYLRKHAARPWRYNLWRLGDALEKILLPRPAAREPGLLARWLLRPPRGLPVPAARDAVSTPADWPPATRVFLVVGNTVRDPGRGGVATLVRSLAAAFGRGNLPVRLVTWNPVARSLSLLAPEFSIGADAEALRDPWPDASGVDTAVSLHDPRAACLDDPSAGNPALHEMMRYRDRAGGAWVLMPEVMYGKGEAIQLVEYVRRCGWRLALIFHDAIPVDAPLFAAPDEPVRHTEYMHFLSGADLILPVSEWSATAWKDFVARRGCHRAPVVVCRPGSDTYTRTRGTGTPTNDAAAPVRILSVSTVGARKNQRVLLAAYERAVAARPDLRLELLLAGAPRPSTDDFPAAIHETMARHAGKVRWVEQADYSAVRGYYEACDFTVYPSEVEGFGLPILESLWFGRPCVCADFGAMVETAAGGGCLTVDVRDPQALADAIIALADSPDLRRRLTAAAIARPLKTWDEYGAEIFTRLLGGND